MIAAPNGRINLAPTSYQAPHKSDVEDKSTFTQTADSGLRAAGDGATVKTILDDKGNAVFSVQPQDTIRDATKIMKEKRIGALVVLDGEGFLVGILSERDIVRQLADTPGQTLAQSVADLMTKDPVTCDPGERVIDMMKRMSEGRFRHLPVIEDGAMAGMITIGDVVKHRLLELEYEALRMKQLIVG